MVLTIPSSRLIAVAVKIMTHLLPGFSLHKTLQVDCATLVLTTDTIEQLDDLLIGFGSGDDGVAYNCVPTSELAELQTESLDIDCTDELRMFLEKVVALAQQHNVDTVVFQGT